MATKRKGDGLLLVYSDVAPEHDKEYNRWYNEEHIPERLSIPGVLDAARYEAVQGGPKYLAAYELDSHEAWYSDAWQKWLKEPTEWSRRMSPSVIGTEYIRNLYKRVHPDELSEETAQAGMSPLILVGRMSFRITLRKSGTTPTTTSGCPWPSTSPATSAPVGSRR